MLISYNEERDRKCIDWLFYARKRLRSFSLVLDDFCLPMLLNCSKNKDLICVDRLRQIYSCHCPSTICKYKQENHQLIGFVEEQCSSEYIHGIHWPKTLVNKGHHVSCPYPCQGIEWNDRIDLSYIIGTDYRSNISFLSNGRSLVEVELYWLSMSDRNPADRSIRVERKSIFLWFLA